MQELRRTRVCSLQACLWSDITAIVHIQPCRPVAVMLCQRRGLVALQAMGLAACNVATYMCMPLKR